MILFLILILLAAFLLYKAIRMSKDRREAQKPKAAEPKPVKKKMYAYDSFYLKSIGMEDDFFEMIKKDLNKNSDYTLTKSELKEYHEDENVYKYYPKVISCRVEEDRVYTFINEDEWFQIGKLPEDRVGKTNGKETLIFYANIYKEVSEDGVEICEDGPYFEMTIRTKQ